MKGGTQVFKVMLVDDEPAALAMEKRAIERRAKEFEVVAEAFSVDAAIALYKQVRPDVVLTDMKMPRKTGLQLVRYINEESEWPTICVVLSGYSDFEYVHDAFSVGVFDYLLKPVDGRKVEELFQRIYRVLMLNREGAEPAVPDKRMKDEKLLEEITAYVRANIRGDNSIMSVCSHFGISQPYLSRLFRQHCGRTYNEFLTDLRIEEAKKLLAGGKDILIGEVAEQVGFNGQFYFSKVFKDATGLTPRDYRNRERHKSENEQKGRTTND